ncbi:DNA polymerase III subunit gamma and tau [Microbacterium sp. 1S1]|uniref:DNA polymerase III subunit gamma and tau n=1 Tax=Microbacterium sp. 1S1 TaxID=2606451 RepID=UPI0039760395
MIGQSQVTDPLMTALRGDRVGHAYLFSGPRGCGKTTSARILARCLNCAEGPTDTPCGTCPSCVELSRAGGGSLDVVEIDAASHNGVDDARDLRERATFAPSRDRFKIFILDEAHMVTPQGFNALLKLVEEPPPHVKFIFATTEPEKVLGTIRSRTHHYPFRLVPPAAMLEYVEKLCAEEGVVVEQGVLPLVVRAGGGSPRDTLSLLDQLIAGSDAPADSETVTVGYARAVALLGYTHGALLDEIVDALAAGDAASAFPAIDRVVQTGQDPRRFVDDLLERLRDLIVIAAVGSGASAVLRGIAEDELDRMRRQAEAFGAARLSRTADVVSAALDDMSGATSPRLHLELMVARVLAAAPGGTEVSGAAASGAAVSGALHPPATTRPPVIPADVRAALGDRRIRDRDRDGDIPGDADGIDLAHAAPSGPAPAPSGPAPAAEHERSPEPDPVPEPARSPEPAPAPTPGSSAAPSAPVTFDRIRDAWPAVLKRLEGISRTSWLLATAVQPLAYDGDSEVLTLGFTSQHDVAKFKGTTPGSGPSDHLRTAIEQEVGVRVKYLPAPMPPGERRASRHRPVPPRRPTPLPHRSLRQEAAPGPRRGQQRRPPSPTGRSRRFRPRPPWHPRHRSQWTRSRRRSRPPPPLRPRRPTAGSTGTSRRCPATTTRPRSTRSRRTIRPTSHRLRTTALPPPSDTDPSPAGCRARGSRRRAAGRHRAHPAGGVQRYGEAVIRQVLGATFLREEPYEPPTRFS